MRPLAHVAQPLERLTSRRFHVGYAPKKRREVSLPPAQPYCSSHAIDMFR